MDWLLIGISLVACYSIGYVCGYLVCRVNAHEERTRIAGYERQLLAALKEDSPRDFISMLNAHERMTQTRIVG